MNNENISDTLYHFTGSGVMRDAVIPPEQKDEECYQKLLIVLRSKYIAARDLSGELQCRAGQIEVGVNPDGHLMNGDFDGFLVKGNITCYCEIPLDSCGRHCKKYGKFGVGLAVAYMALVGARPVYYMPYTNSSHLSAHGEGLITRIDASLKDFFSVAENESTGSVLELLERVITKDFAAFVKPYNCELSLDDPDNFYTEREWRLLGSVEVTPKVVKRIVVAAGYANRLRQDLPQFSECEIHEL